MTIAISAAFGVAAALWLIPLRERTLPVPSIAATASEAVPLPNAGDDA